MTKDSAVPARIADGSVLWLRAGDLLVVQFGGGRCTQLARVVDPTGASRGRVRLVKYRARSKRWTKPVIEHPSRIFGRATA